MRPDVLDEICLARLKRRIGQPPPQQFVAQPDAVGVDDIAFAIVSNFADLPLPIELLDLVAVGCRTACRASYLEPQTAGAALSMSPFIVLLAVFFWSFLWGIAGAFIGLPIMIAILTICEQQKSTEWIALLVR